jgi:tripartite-type tricarboxylate transporter receptor subunit TctC
MRLGTLAAAGLALAAAALGAGTVRADAVSDFYKGRQVNLIVGYGTGGGYDVYARVLARHMTKHIPGNPNIIIQNMPGAGSLVAANYLYNVAPKDGSAFGAFSRTIAVLGLLPGNTKAKYDPRQFTWLGSSSSYANDAYVLLIRKDAKVKSLEDARKMDGPPIILGSTAEGSTSDAIPTVLRELIGLNVKAVSGYRDSGILFLAMERGEVDGRTVGLSAIRSNKPDWIKPDGMMRILVVFGRPTRHPDFPDVPTGREIAKGPREKQIIEVLDIPYLLSRPYAAPPGVPADRAKALQSAFMATHKDSEYLAETAKLDIDVSPIDGQQILKLIDQVSKLPPDMMAEVEKLLD